MNNPVQQHRYKGRLFIVYHVSVTDEGEDNCEYYYWDEQGGMKAKAFIPFATIAQNIQDIEWVVDTGGMITEEDIEAGREYCREQLGTNAVKH